MDEGVYQRLFSADDIDNYDWNGIDRALREGLLLSDLPTKVVRSEKYLGFIDYRGKRFVMKLVRNRKGDYNLSERVDEIYKIWGEYDKSVVDIECDVLKRSRLMCPCEWLEYVDGVDKIKDLFLRCYGRKG